MSELTLEKQMTRDSEFQTLLGKKLPELGRLEKLIRSFKERPALQSQFQPRVQIETLVDFRGMKFPSYSLAFGTEDKTAPCLGLFAGVHGLERIGSEVLISWIQSLAELLQWDHTLQEKLQNSRILFMPIINPVGMFLTRRSNGNGVDLMRNAPVQANEPPVFLLGGQTYSKRLPWFRGQTDTSETMEIENQAVGRFVEREMFPSRLSLSVDVHSGFGSVDRFWFPYAKSKNPPPHVAEITALKRLFDRSYPNHFYQIEPQAKAYTTHGDLWDWLYDRRQKEAPQGLYLPWTLELGSWIWLKKNPRQLFSSLGAFNPMQPHRMKRILRRHVTLFDFLHRAVMSPAAWVELDVETRMRLEQRAKDLWYE